MPCPTHNPCPSDVAVENLSAEDPDIDQFIGFYSKFTNPRLGMDFGDTGLPGWCASAASPLAAIICARNGSLTNNQNGSITAADIEGMPPPVALPAVEGSPTAVVRRVAGKRFVVPGRAPVGQFFRVLGDQSDIGPWLNKDQHCFAYCPTGKEFEGVQEAGTILSYFSQAEADAQAKAIACSKAEQSRVCFIPINRGPYCVNTKVEIAILCANSTGKIVTLSMVGFVPGMAFTQTPGTNAGVLKGFPTEVGAFGFDIQASVEGVGIASQAYELDVFGIDNQGPSVVVGLASTFQYTVGGPFTAPLSFSTPNTMPPGLTLQSDGRITGTATTQGTYPVEIRFSDGSGKGCTIEDLITVFPCQGTIVFGTAPGGSCVVQNTTFICGPPIPSGPVQGAYRYHVAGIPTWCLGGTCKDDPHTGFFCANLESRVNYNYVFTITNPCPFAQNMRITIGPTNTGGFLLDGVAATGIVSVSSGVHTCELIMGYHSFYDDCTQRCALDYTFEFI